MTKSRNPYVTVYQSITGWTAVMRAEYEDEPGEWMEDNVQTGIGKYPTREAAEYEARGWALEEQVPFMGADGKKVMLEEVREMTINELLQMYRKAAQKFIRKCEDGRAKSVETLRELRACEEAAKEFYMKEAEDDQT